MKNLINDLATFKKLTTTFYMDNYETIKIKNIEFH